MHVHEKEERKKDHWWTTHYLYIDLRNYRAILIFFSSLYIDDDDRLAIIIWKEGIWWKRRETITACTHRIVVCYGTSHSLFHDHRSAWDKFICLYIHTAESWVAMCLKQLWNWNCCVNFFLFNFLPHSVCSDVFVWREKKNLNSKRKNILLKLKKSCLIMSWWLAQFFSIFFPRIFIAVFIYFFSFRPFFDVLNSSGFFSSHFLN